MKASSEASKKGFERGKLAAHVIAPLNLRHRRFEVSFQAFLEAIRTAVQGGFSE